VTLILNFVYEAFRDAEGNVAGILVIAFDVTEAVSARAGAEASERHFRELLDNLPELAWDAAPDGHIEFYNRRWYEYTGTTPEQMEGWGWGSVHDPKMLPSIEERWKESLGSGEPFEMEFQLRGADGVFRWFLTRAVPLRDARGRVVRWLGTNSNIDERIRNDAFKEVFLGILGHDLRNPLASILTTARVMSMRGELSPPNQKHVSGIVSSGARMQRMIDQLLDMTRARLAGGIPVTLSAEELDLAPLLSRWVEGARAAHPARVIELHVDGSGAARMDADRIEQVVSNILGNAVTHGAADKPIRVALVEREASVSMTVHNSGAPIDPSFLPLLFNPFARSTKLTGRSDGLGLGLFISERIVAAHGGRIMVDSSSESGTRFEVILPKQVLRG
jgi:PAS domain S-box-containing protein